MMDTVVHDRRTPAVVWGYNGTGGLGLGHTATAYRPVRTTVPAGLADLQGGVEFSVALTRGGDVLSWGGNQSGQLAAPGLRGRREPDRVKLSARVQAQAIAAGSDHVLVLGHDRQLLAWGSNHWGQLGDGTTTDRHEPVRLRTKPLTAIAAGNGISVAITADGELLAWGRNTRGQLGLPGATGRKPEVHRPAAVQLPRGTTVKAVDAGRHHVVVLTTAGRVLQFGSDAFGQPAAAQPRLRASWGRVIAISAGDEFTVALTDRRVLLTWGQNGNGQLGLGDTRSRVHPSVVQLPTTRGHVTDILAGARSATVVTSAREVYSWGEARHGQGGGGKVSDDQLKPQLVTRLTRKVTGLYGGAHHTVITTMAGTAVALRLRPEVTTVRPGQPVTYRIHEVDAFGTDLGVTRRRVHLQLSRGEVSGRSVRSRIPGTHRVVAVAGRLRGTAILVVKKGR